MVEGAERIFPPERFADIVFEESKAFCREELKTRMPDHHTLWDFEDDDEELCDSIICAIFGYRQIGELYKKQNEYDFTFVRALVSIVPSVLLYGDVATQSIRHILGQQTIDEIINSTAQSMVIRSSEKNEAQPIGYFYAKEVPDQEIRLLVNELLMGDHRTLSLVGLIGSQLVGHVVFTIGRVNGTGKSVALLGPLAVATAWRRRGIGASLVHRGLQTLRTDDVASVFVRGDPSYFRRFGFSPEENVLPPYALRPEDKDTWQSVELMDDEDPVSGNLVLPQPWLRSELWMPDQGE